MILIIIIFFVIPIVLTYIASRDSEEQEIYGMTKEAEETLKNERK